MQSYVTKVRQTPDKNRIGSTGYVRLLWESIEEDNELSYAAIFEVKFGKKSEGAMTDSRGRTADALHKNPEADALAIEGSDLSITEDNFVPTARCVQDIKKRQLVTRSSLQRLRCFVCHLHLEQAMKALYRVRQFFAKVLKKAQHYMVVRCSRRKKEEEKISRLSHSLSSSDHVDTCDSDSAEEMDQKHSKLGATPKWCAHADWPIQWSEDSPTWTIPPWRDQSLWRITTTKTVEGLSEQPKCGVKQQCEAPLRKHTIEYAKLMKEYEDMKAARSGKYEEFEEKEKGWKKTFEEIFSLMKELKGKTRGQKVEKNSEEEHKEVSQSQGSGTKIRKGREEQNTSAAQTLGIKRDVEEIQEKEEQPFHECQGDESGDKKGRITKKKIRKRAGQNASENEEGKKKKIRKCTRKRSRSEGRCELSEEREEKEQKNQKEVES